MREIKFRGKIKNKKDLKRFINNNGWVYGYYLKDDTTNIKFCKNDIKIKGKTKHYIINTTDDNEFIEVIPKTVGQFTGEYDKNKKPIYEGDIVKVNEKFTDIVEYDCGCFLMQKQAFNYEFTYQDFEYIEVIGNIYDNKEDILTNERRNIKEIR